MRWRNRWRVCSDPGDGLGLRWNAFEDVEMDEGLVEDGEPEEED